MTFLQKQLDLWERQADSWKLSHDEAMTCRDVEDVVAFLGTFLRRLRRWSGQWERDVEAGSVEFSWEQSEMFCSWYRRWLELATDVLDTVRQLEAKNYHVEQADRLRTMHHDVSLMALGTDRVRASIASLENGEGIPAGQMMNEIRHNLRS